MILKVLHIIWSLYRGGAEKSTLYLASKLKEMGIDTAVLVLQDVGGLNDEYRISGIPVFARLTFKGLIKSVLPEPLLEFAYRRRIPRYRKQYEQVHQPYISSINSRSIEHFVKKHIDLLEPDIVHVHQHNCMYSLRWAKACGIKNIIYTHHNMTSEVLPTEEILALNDLIQDSHWITFVSYAQRLDFLNCITYPLEQTSVIYPQTTFNGKPKIHYPISNPLVLGTMSNLSPIKNPLVLLDAIKILREKGKNLRLLVAGGDPKWKVVIEEEVRKRNLQGYISFIGNLKTNDQLNDFYSSIDVYISTSLSESFSLTLTESMSCGVPVISSNVRTVNEVVDDGTTGLVFDQTDTVDLSSKIMFFIENRTEVERMGIQALNRYRIHFGEISIPLMYLKLYKQLLNS